MSPIRLHAQETLPDPKQTPLWYFGSDLRLWLSGGEEFYEDAEKTDPCEDADVVEVWGDNSGNEWDGTKVSAPIYIAAGANGIGGLQCAGGDGGLSMSTDVIPHGTAELWYFTVVKLPGPEGYKYTVTYNHEASGKFAFQAYEGWQIHMTVGTTGGQKVLGLNCDTTDYVVLTCRAKEGVEWRLWRNGVNKGAVDCSGTTWQWVAPEGNYYQFFYNSQTGIIMEHWVVLGDIGAVGRQWAESHLMWKYNLS